MKINAISNRFSERKRQDSICKPSENRFEKTNFNDILVEEEQKLNLKEKEKNNNDRK